MHSIIRDEDGRLVPVVQPKRWQSASLKQSRQRTDRIALARKRRRAWRATTEWINALDRRGIAALEEAGIPWAAVQRWLDGFEPPEAGAARRILTWVLRVLADDGVPLRERFAACNELYGRMIAAGVID